MARYSTNEADEQLGVDPRVVRRLCSIHGIGEKVGRDWVLTPSDIAKLRAVYRGKPGRPPKDAE